MEVLGVVIYQKDMLRSIANTRLNLVGYQEKSLIGALRIGDLVGMDRIMMVITLQYHLMHLKGSRLEAGTTFQVGNMME